MTRLGLFLALLLPLGCGDETPNTPPEPPVEPVICAAGELLLDDGRCFAAGVAACAEGFMEDGRGGCVAGLPPMCPEGTMALPGEEACRPVADCGDGPWGAIPVEADTQYVDASFTGTSTGSAEQPWTTIADGIDAASAGGMVAVAAGQYADAEITGKAVRLWGRCPDLVTVRDDNGDFAVAVTDGAHGTEIHALAVSSPDTTLIGISGAENVLFDQVWIHHGTTEVSVSVIPLVGPTSVTFRRSLIEASANIGIRSQGSVITVEDSVIRDGSDPGGVGFGAGLMVQADGDGVPSTAVVRGSVFEQTAGLGIFVEGSNAEVNGSVLRDTHVIGANTGRGIAVQTQPTLGTPSGLLLAGSVLERNADMGLFVYGSEVTLDGSTIRDTLPGNNGIDGRGLNATVDPDAALRAKVTLSRSTLERNTFVNLVLSGAEALVEHSISRDVIAPADDEAGRAVQIQRSASSAEPSSATLRSTLIEGARDIGIFIGDSDAVLEGVLVRGTTARPDGLFGDGITVFAANQPASAVMRGVAVTGSARAGVASFAALIDIADSAITCNAFDFNFESYDDRPPTLVDGGGNACGCEEAADCKAVSAMLDPPDPL